MATTIEACSEITNPFHQPQPPNTNWAILAGLRFVLAWIVISGHLFWFSTDAGQFFRFSDSFGGKAAVIGFLMVSGYSIAASLQKHAVGFYRRRLNRIYPLYFFSLILAVALQASFKEIHLPFQTLQRSSLLTVFGNFLFLQTFLVKPIAYDPVVWSLSIEFAYYLLAPLLILLRTRTIVLLIVVSALAYLVPTHGERGLLLFVIGKFNALRYLWAWLVGFLCFRNRHPAILAGTASLGIALVSNNNDGSLSVLTFAFSFVILNISGMVPTRPVFKKMLNYLGDLSYPLYLVHFPVFIIGYSIFNMTNPWTLVASSLLATMLSYHVVDIYCKRVFFMPIINAASASLHRRLGLLKAHRSSRVKEIRS